MHTGAEWQAVDDGQALRLGFALMGGRAELLLAGGSEPRRRQGAELAVQEARRIEAAYSRYRPDSIVSCINAAAGSGRPIQVDTETAALLNFGAQLHHDSGGRFDLTSGILRQAWDFERPVRPSPAQLKSLCDRIGWQRVTWDGQCIALPQAGMEIDFGGIGKEYAADRCAALLLEFGLSHGWVNFGGDIRVLGPMPGGRPWRMGVRHPRRPDQTLATVELHGGALATSGDYERCIVVDGERLCHLLDPRTGWPVAHWQSVSVRAPLCVAAGALSTVAMLMGALGADWLAAQGVDWLGVDAHGALHAHPPLP